MSTVVDKKLTPEEWREKAEGLVVDFLKENVAAHAREIKIALEYGPFHWVTQNAITKLYNEGKLRRRKRSYEEKSGRTATFYYLKELRYSDVAEVIERKLPVIKAYTELNENPEKRKKMGHLAEDFLIPLFEKAGYVVVARDARFFRGKEWPRLTDLDLIVYGQDENRWYGVQIKNALDYPEWDDIAELLDICRFLGLVPWLVCRNCPKDYIWEIIQCGGFVTLFWERRWLLTQEYKDVAELIEINTKIKVTTPSTLKEFADVFVHDIKLIHSIKPKGKS